MKTQSQMIFEMNFIAYLEWNKSRVSRTNSFKEKFHRKGAEDAETNGIIVNSLYVSAAVAFEINFIERQHSARVQSKLYGKKNGISEIRYAVSFFFAIY